MTERPLRLLLVEDNPGDVRLIRESLGAQAEALLETVGDLAAAFDRCQSSAPDVVLLDLGLPDSQGLSTLSAFQSRFPRIPIVVLTGNIDLDTSLEAVKIGAQDYLVKGAVDGALLLRAARYARERKRAQERLRDNEERLRRAHRELQETTAQLLHSTKLHALGELAAGVVHDLSQPLNAIGIICQSLCRYFPEYSPEDLKRELGEISQMVLNMRTILDQLTAFTRRSVEQELQPIDINVAVDRALTVVGHQIETDGIVLRQHMSPDLPPVAADLARLQQVFVNLLVNARDALMQVDVAHRQLDVRTFVPRGEALVTVEVQDTGPGVPEELKSKLFTPFFTTKAPGRGTGLGLTIARRIVEEHQGRLEVETELGRGTTFRVLLPASSG